MPSGATQICKAICPCLDVPSHDYFWTSVNAFHSLLSAPFRWGDLSAVTRCSLQSASSGLWSTSRSTAPIYHGFGNSPGSCSFYRWKHSSPERAGNLTKFSLSSRTEKNLNNSKVLFVISCKFAQHYKIRGNSLFMKNRVMVTVKNLRNGLCLFNLSCPVALLLTFE